MKWKPLIYRGIDYGDFYDISELGHIKRKAYYQVNQSSKVFMEEKIHKPIERFNVVVKPLGIRKDIDVKRAVAENFLGVETEYLYVAKYDDAVDNRYTNLFWTNEKETKRLPTTYNVFRSRDDEKKNKAIVDDYLDGVSYKEMIDKHLVTRHYIRNVLDERGIKREQMRGRGNPNIDLEAMKKMFLDFRSLTYVAKQTGISRHAVAYYKRKLGFGLKYDYEKIKNNEEKQI
jgi:hypothetical protein